MQRDHLSDDRTGNVLDAGHIQNDFLKPELVWQEEKFMPEILDVLFVIDMRNPKLNDGNVAMLGHF